MNDSHPPPPHPPPLLPFSPCVKLATVKILTPETISLKTKQNEQTKTETKITKCIDCTASSSASRLKSVNQWTFYFMCVHSEMTLEKRSVILGISTHYGRVSTCPVPCHNFQNQHRYHHHRYHCRRHRPHQYRQGRVIDCRFTVFRNKAKLTSHASYKTMTKPFHHERQNYSVLITKGRTE